MQSRTRFDPRWSSPSNDLLLSIAALTTLLNNRNEPRKATKERDRSIAHPHINVPSSISMDWKRTSVSIRRHSWNVEIPDRWKQFQRRQHPHESKYVHVRLGNDCSTSRITPSIRFNLQMAPNSTRLSKAHAPVVPNVAQTYEEWPREHVKSPFHLHRMEWDHSPYPWQSPVEEHCHADAVYHRWVRDSTWPDQLDMPFRLTNALDQSNKQPAVR